MEPLNDKVDSAAVLQTQSLLSTISKTITVIPSAFFLLESSTVSTAAAVPDDATSKQPVLEPSSEQKQIAITRTLRSMTDGKISTTDTFTKDESEVNRQWYIDDVVQSMALNGTFTIYFFISGRVIHIFAAPAEACHNCGQQRDAAQLESGTVPINPILLDHVIAGSLVDMTPDRVKPFLAAGNRVDIRSVAGMQIGISSKLAPLDVSGDIGLEEYPEVVQQIIEQSS
ncbi:putative tyrosinase [Seiridium cardinale]|uniref:Tyrosinase n=1 Tax=Seiridium cardinale TaxID=138064 RepID=A0ABR2X706_9PEZI